MELISLNVKFFRQKFKMIFSIFLKGNFTPFFPCVFSRSLGSISTSIPK